VKRDCALLGTGKGRIGTWPARGGGNSASRVLEEPAGVRTEPSTLKPEGSHYSTLWANRSLMQARELSCGGIGDDRRALEPAAGSGVVESGPRKTLGKAKTICRWGRRNSSNPILADRVRQPRASAARLLLVFLNPDPLAVDQLPDPLFGRLGL
jgi:hypothetical protein